MLLADVRKWLEPVRSIPLQHCEPNDVIEWLG